MAVDDDHCQTCQDAAHADLGEDVSQLGEPQSNCVDMYICRQGISDPDDYTLIRRSAKLQVYGSEPSNYGCVAVMHAGGTVSVS
jgi:hypothetical protein